MSRGIRTRTPVGFWRLRDAPSQWTCSTLSGTPHNPDSCHNVNSGNGLKGWTDLLHNLSSTYVDLYLFIYLFNTKRNKQNWYITTYIHTYTHIYMYTSQKPTPNTYSYLVDDPRSSSVFLICFCLVFNYFSCIMLLFYNFNVLHS